MIDNQGRIKGRVSIIDIVIVVAILALIAGFIYRQAAPHIADIVRPDDTFHVTFEVNRIRSVIAEDTVVIGEMIFRQHDRQALGRIVAVERNPATEVMMRTDGTAVLATMDDRYSLRITIEATGNVTDSGFFANGNDPMAPGAEVVLINSRFIFPLARVYSVEAIPPVE
ncbi:MAG: DUF4330 domain-containing protein [Defluviitaleaceae bacterium]|nr:DUF4330 domain-containing protein [Defluviitaleaceae bacterium]